MNYICFSVREAQRSQGSKAPRPQDCTYTWIVISVDMMQSFIHVVTNKHTLDTHMLRRPDFSTRVVLVMNCTGEVVKGYFLSQGV